MKILLHCCCAPCLVQCAESLAGEQIKPDLFWYNPNIHPYMEYKNRRDTLVQYAADQNLDLTLFDEYGLRSFIYGVGPEDTGGGDRPARCAWCYSTRLEKTAALAAERGYDAFCTTLLISPWQDHEGIRRAAEAAAEKHGVDFLYRDFRPRFREGQAEARALGFYMQKYCGCIFSEEERYLKKREPARV
jgi:predicted adenine nucleotide alpha hydrolase (AANH) superfamily ATPase